MQMSRLGKDVERRENGFKTCRHAERERVRTEFKLSQEILGDAVMLEVSKSARSASLTKRFHGILA